MAFVKLDCGMLDSTIWIDRAARELFITALLMAEPYEVDEPIPAIQVASLKESGFVVPPGWYGFVAAAGPGIVNRAGMEAKAGIEALERLGEPEPESRTPDHEGRRMVRINGGYIVLNFDKYRQKDHTAAERSKRYRDKQAASRVTNGSSRVETPTVTQAESREQRADLPSAKAGNGKLPKKSPTTEHTPHAEFIHRWTEEYPNHHDGSEYAFAGGRDAAAITTLLARSKLTPSELLDFAISAWGNPSGFNCKFAAGISGFASRFNEIRHELRTVRNGSRSPDHHIPSIDEASQ